MHPNGAYNPQRRGAKLLGRAVLLLGLPMAIFGALHPPNEYEATLAIDALDCDGPLGTYIFAVPSLVLYGAALIINGLRWRRRANLIVALLCFLVCAALATNIARAVLENRQQEAACSSR